MYDNDLNPRNLTNTFIIITIYHLHGPSHKLSIPQEPTESGNILVPDWLITSHVT